MIYQYWIIGELVFVILFFSVIIFNLWRNAKNKTGKITLHETVTGKLWHYTKYFLRILGVGLGTLLGLSLSVMIERNILSVYLGDCAHAQQCGSPITASLNLQVPARRLGSSPKPPIAMVRPKDQTNMQHE